MTSRIPIPQLAGSLDAYVDQDIKITDLAADTVVTGAFLHVVGAPSTGVYVAEIANAENQTGQAFLNTILTGQNSGSVTGQTLAGAAGGAIYLRTLNGAGALELSGYIELDADPTFTSLDAVKQHAGIDNSDLDPLIASLIGGRTRAMQSWMQATVLQKTHTQERYNGREGWTGCIVLEEAPWQSISSLTLDGEVLTEGEDFELDQKRGLLVRGTWARQRAWEPGEILVDGVSGYTNAPPDLELACTEQVRHDLAQAQAAGNRVGMTSQAMPQGGQTNFVPTGWLDSTVALMSPYRETRRGL